MTDQNAVPRKLGEHRKLNVSLWIAQTLIFLSFVTFGSMKLLTPVERLAAMWIWPAQVPAWFLHLTGILDIAGGVGVFLPALTRVRPRLTVLAALGCTLLQVSAIIFHISRGEAFVTPLNFVLLALCAFILWGRMLKVRISPRE